MDSKLRPLIHIGFPKAASTWLQRGLFSDEKAGLIAPWGVQAGEAVEQFALPNPFRFSAESARKVFELGLEEAARRSLVPVLSHEMLTGDQMKGFYWGKEVADRIHVIFPDAKILIFIREQKSMIWSSYQQYLKEGGVLTLQRYIDPGVKKAGSFRLAMIN